MANILYKTDYYTNVYLLYLDDVPISEVVEALGTTAGGAGVPPGGSLPELSIAPVAPLLDLGKTTVAPLGPPAGPMRAPGTGIPPGDTGYRG